MQTVNLAPTFGGVPLLPEVGTGGQYLSTELEVDHHDADLGAGHHQDDEHQEQEAKQVVELVLPDSLQTSTGDLITHTHGKKTSWVNAGLTCPNHRYPEGLTCPNHR